MVLPKLPQYGQRCDLTRFDAAEGIVGVLRLNALPKEPSLDHSVVHGGEVIPRRSELRFLDAGEHTELSLIGHAEILSTSMMN